MLNEFFELFAGAYNEFVPDDYINHDYFLCILFIVVTACVIVGCFAVAVASLVGVARALLRRG